MQSMQGKRDNATTTVVPQTAPDQAPHDNAPGCPECDGKVLPTAAALDGIGSDPAELYCVGCGYTWIETEPAVIAWGWYAFGARDGYEYQDREDSADWFADNDGGEQ